MYEEVLYPTWSVMLWDKVRVDVVKMPKAFDGSIHLVFARNDLSGWVEGRALDAANSYNVREFLYEEVTFRHGCLRRIVLNEGSENMDMTAELMDYRIQNTTISAYHPQTAGLVERGHGPIINAIAKYSRDNPEQWPTHLSLALWADRISIRRSTGFSTFELLYGRDCLLPVELMVESWQTVDWKAVESREDLIHARMEELDQTRVVKILAAMNLRNSRKANKAYFDNAKRLRPQSQLLQPGDMVLLFDNAILRSRGVKLKDKWRGPFRITEKSKKSTFYLLAELDGTPLARNIAGNRLKKFYSRDVKKLLKEAEQFNDVA